MTLHALTKPFLSQPTLTPAPQGGIRTHPQLAERWATRPCAQASSTTDVYASFSHAQAREVPSGTKSENEARH